MYFDFGSKLPYAYIQMGRLRINSSQLQFENESESVVFPSGRLGAIFIGPGATVTDGAIKYCVATGCMLLWVGEDVTKCYAVVPTISQSSDNLLKQIDLYTKNKNILLKRYCELRFKHPLLGWKNLNEEKIRGIEGAYVKKIYVECAKEYGIPWSGRMKEDEWSKNKVYDKGISLCNSYLYGMSCAVLNALGFSTALGILHKGDTRSLVFDIADIYKAEFSIPLAFEIARDVGLGIFNAEVAEAEIRKRSLRKFQEKNLLRRMVEDIKGLYDGCVRSEELEGKNEEDAIGI